MREPGDETDISSDAPKTSKPTLRCMCCGTRYERGKFKCCAPTGNMSSQRWLELACPKPADGGCGKCFRHCQCPGKEARLGKGPLADMAKMFMDRFTREEP